MCAFLTNAIVLVTVTLTVGAGQGGNSPPKDKAKKAVAAQPPQGPGVSGKSSDAVPKNVPGMVEVTFRDGCVIRMIVQTEKLDIATFYGNLSVPVKELKAIEFGMHYPEGIAAKIDAAVQNLGSVEFRERDKAGKMLVEWGPLAYPAVFAARQSTDLEIAKRAKDVLKQLQANHTKKELEARAEDKVVTHRFTIVGKIRTAAFKATTDLFGPVELSVAKMQTLRTITSGGRSQEVVLSVDAAKFAVAGQWMDSGYESDGFTRVQITAQGAVDTWPQQPGQWMVGAGGQQGGGNIMVFGGGGVGRQIVPQVNGGALFGRIGENGEPFMIGAQYEGTLNKEGKLYLHIAPSPWNCNSTGTYEVKITRINR